MTLSSQKRAATVAVKHSTSKDGKELHVCIHVEWWWGGGGGREGKGVFSLEIAHQVVQRYKLP